MSETPQESRATGRWALKAAGVILWTFLLVAAYFWAHKPFDAEIVSGLGRSLLSILAWLGITFLSAALGRRVLVQIVDHEWVYARLALSAGAGLGLLSLILMLLGLLGLLSPWVAWALIVGLALLLRPSLQETLDDVRSLRLPRPEGKLQRWFLLYGAASLVLTLVRALAPPTAWDSLVYHLTGPRLYVEAGRLVHPFDLAYLGFPQLGQMQFTLGLLLVGDGPAALFHFGYGLLALVVTVALARRAFGDTAAWFAGALLLSVPTLFSLMSWPYVDITLLFYATAAFYTFLRWRHVHLSGSNETGWLTAMGLVCGFSGSVKYTAVAIPFALALSMAWIMRRKGVAATARRLALVAAIAMALVAPYLLENWLTTGNPVYPFLFDHGRYWDQWRAWWYDRPGTGLATTAPWRLPFVPLELAVLGTEGSEFYDATVGPLLLISVGLLAAVWRPLNREERATVGHIFLFVGLNYVLWLTGAARTGLLLQSRLLFFTFGVMAALGGVALARLPTLRRPQLAPDWLVRTAIAAMLALILFTAVTDFLALNPLPVTLGVETREAYLSRTLGTYQAAVNAVNELPAGSRILFLWEPRSYACQVDCRPDALLDRFLHHTHFLQQDAAAIAAAWRAEGVTHVLLNQAGLDFVVEAAFDPVTLNDLATLRALEEKQLSLVQNWGESYRLYEVRP